MPASPAATQSRAEHFLIVGPAWVGDMVMAQSLFMSLKLRHPAARITVIAPAWTLPLLARMPQVDFSLSIPIGHGELRLAARYALGKVLRMNGYTHAIVLPNSFKSALLPLFARIPRRIGWRGEWRNLLLTDCRRLDPAALPLMVQRFAALAYATADDLPARLPRPKLRIDAEIVQQTLDKFSLTGERPILALCPGAEFGPSKQWPAGHWAALSNAMIAAGWDVWLFGSGNDKEIASTIVSGVDGDKLAHCRNLAGNTSLAQAIDLMSASTAVVSNDSGLMHVAAALEKPLVAIFGSTSPDFTPPLTERVQVLSSDIECRPCFKRQCPYGHLRCLNELLPDQVVVALGELTTQTN